MLQGLGLLLVAGGVVAFLTPLGTPALVVGVLLGVGLLGSTFVGGGPQPLPESGFTFDEAMAVLKRASLGGTLVGGAAVVAVAFLWWLGRAGPVDAVQVFLLSLLVAYASTVTAAGVVTVAELEGRN